MSNKVIFVGVLFLFFRLSLFSQTENTKEQSQAKPNLENKTNPVKAQSILGKSISKSVTVKKNVFLIFHASWCGWCKRLDKVLESPEMKKIFDKYFIITHLDVLENGDKVKTLENPGGRDLLEKYGGSKSGLPFYVFIDKTGKKIKDSNVMPKNGNIGYPGSSEEIVEFVKLLKISSSKITDEETTAITEYLTKNAPSVNSPSVVPNPVKNPEKTTK